MFGYKRSYYPKRYSSTKFSQPYTKYYRRGTVGRAASGAAAAKRSDKSETYNCTISGVMGVRTPVGLNLSNVKVFHPYAGGVRNEGIVDDERNLVHGGAVCDRGFRMKCATYDEVKLDSMKVTITPAKLFQNATVTITLCTMWDRKASPKECGFVGGGEWMANGAKPTALEIYNNEGTIKSTMTNNTIYGYKRYCKASSIIEKGGYHDSSILYNPTAGISPLSVMYQDAWMRGALPFSPALFFIVYCPATSTLPIDWHFSYKVEYNFTFRNPKSDLDYFLTLETPGYVNAEEEDGRRTTTNRSSLSDPIVTDIIKNYKLKTLKEQETPVTKETLDTLFTKPKEDEKEEEEKEEKQNTME